jgi:hypothetical protein
MSYRYFISWSYAYDRGSGFGNSLTTTLQPIGVGNTVHLIEAGLIHELSQQAKFQGQHPTVTLLYFAPVPWSEEV